MTDPLACLSATQPRPPARRPRTVVVPPALIALAQDQLGLVSRAQCAASGMPKGRIERLLARGEWRTVTRGVLLTDPRAVASEDWNARARQRAFVAALAGGPDCVLVGLAALALHRVHGAPLKYIPEFILRSGAHVRSCAEVRARRLGRRPDVPGHPKVVVVDGVAVAGPLWALAQALPFLDREHAVSVVDSAHYQQKLRDADLPLLLQLLSSGRGVRSLRKWLALVDGRAESPLETRARLICQDHGVPPDDLQRVVRGAANVFLARCDMVWELGGGRLLIIEMDGGHHRRDGQIDVDNARDNALTQLGHVVYHFGWRHLAGGVIPRTVRAELARAGRVLPSAR